MKRIAAALSSVFISYCGAPCDHPVETYTTTEQDCESLCIEIESPVVHGRRPDYSRISCSSETPYILSMYSRTHDNQTQSLAYPGPAARHMIEAWLSPDEMEDIASIGCIAEVPERRVCDWDHCNIDDRMVIKEKEVALIPSGDVCMDDYYNEPDFPWRGGRNL
ncbi:hypothetical protein HQ545_04795 [Candidatus Woesearchaeota archaeon]|nr:hypothetical protein [Candidatus Woesearchaeota archaeon]